MEYKGIDGPVFSRRALSPPIINSSMANEFGLKASCSMEPGQYVGLETGANVKLRLLLNHGKRKITCHGVIDWIKFDESRGKHYIGFGSLSLSDKEFHILERNFVEEPDEPVEFVQKIREKARDVESAVALDEAAEIMRHKAVNFPVSVIDAIEAARGDTPFSAFVVDAVRTYLDK